MCPIVIIFILPICSHHLGRPFRHAINRNHRPRCSYVLCFSALKSRPFTLNRWESTHGWRDYNLLRRWKHGTSGLNPWNRWWKHFLVFSSPRVWQHHHTIGNVVGNTFLNCKSAPLCIVLWIGARSPARPRGAQPCLRPPRTSPSNNNNNNNNNCFFIRKGVFF